MAEWSMEENLRDILAVLDEENSAAYRLLGEAQAAGKESYPPDNADGLGCVGNSDEPLNNLPRSST